MPGPKATSSRRGPAAGPRPRPAADAGPAFALVVVDHRRLHHLAWARVHTAQKRLEKATRDLHRHEEIDTPAFHSWVHRTFPLLLTTLRTLHEEAAEKLRRIQAVEATAFMTGRSVKRIWREEKQRAAEPEAFPPDEPPADDPDWEWPPDEDAGGPNVPLPPQPKRSATAREIYRRLVSRLHPDRGGEWTAARQRVWHDVQLAWESGDADWLARLEVDWETANEVLGPDSPLGRLYRAIEELEAARRDTERKLREYRQAPPWRFTLTEKRRITLVRRMEEEFQMEIAYLQSQLRHLNAQIAAWEDDWTRAEARGNSTRRRRR
jgi:hypothetical protein